MRRQNVLIYFIILLFFHSQLSSQLITWLFCSPCILFLKTSKTFHKMTITGITLIVTALLVVSPIIFLISAAPNMPKQCNECFEIPPPECQDPVCKSVASSIQAKIDWNVDFCNDFKSFSCSSQQNSLRIVKTPQEIADNQMLRKLIFQLLATYYFRFNDDIPCIRDYHQFRWRIWVDSSRLSTLWHEQFFQFFTFVLPAPNSCWVGISWEFSKKGNLRLLFLSIKCVDT